MRLPLGGRRQGRLIGVRDGQPNPHAGGAVTRHRAEDEERAILPRYEPDVAVLSARKALLKARAGRVLERRWDGTGGNHRPIWDDFDRGGQGGGDRKSTRLNS